VFQPAEEGPPPGEDGGAELMLEQGVFADLRPEAMFGLHATNSESGKIFAAAGPIMASSDALRIVVRGRQTHAARPQEGVDPITVAAQIVTALQLIPTRQFDAVNSPIVISIGQIQGGVRRNIIPDQVEMHGTIRVLNATARGEVLSRVRRTAQQVAASAGAEVDVDFSEGNPVLVNDASTTERAVNALRAALGADAIATARPIMAAEDFAFFAEEVPSFYFNFGVNAPGVTDAAPNHSPHFYVHEPALETGLRGILAVALDRISGQHDVDEQ
jgi:amidohydrolase